MIAMRGLVSFVAGIAVAGSVAVGVAVTVPAGAGTQHAPHVRCYEDQVIAWHNGSHSVCLDADDKQLDKRITQTAKGE